MSDPRPGVLDPLVVEARFNGPPQSGNGGFVAGRLARRLHARTVEVTLRAPPPLGVPLQVRARADGGLALHDGDTLLAEARAAGLELDVPPAPAYDDAHAAGALGRMRAGSRTGNPYLRCFGCGIERHDGLRIIPSPVGETGIVATTWTPDASLAAPGQPAGTAAGFTTGFATGFAPEVPAEVATEIVWAALDCPAGIAWVHRLPDAPPLVTGRITACIDGPILTGEPHIVIGWPIARDGRKLYAGTAVFDARGGLRARSLQLWLVPREAAA